MSRDLADGAIQGYRLSPQQRHLWLLSHGGQPSPYRVQGALRIKGGLDPQVLTAAIGEVVARHEILRTAFDHLPEMSTPVQVIRESGSIACRLADLSGLNLHDQKERVTALFREACEQPLEPEEGTCLSASLITLAAERNVLLLGLPALCSDAMGMKNLGREIATAYAARAGGMGYESEAIQYADLSEWLHELCEAEEGARGREYWEAKRIDSAGGPSLPFERKGGRAKDFFPRAIASTITPEVAAGVLSLAKRQGTSAAAIMLAGWQALLWRLMGRAEIVVGAACAGRSYEELEGALGLFTRYLPVRSRLVGDEDFMTLVGRADAALRDLSTWQDYFRWRTPAEEGADDEPFFSAAFECEEGATSFTAAGLSFSFDRLHACCDRFKIKLSCHSAGDSLSAEIGYDASLFTEEAVRRLAEQFHTLLANAVNDPHAPVSRLELMSESERQEVLVEFNRTKAEYPAESCLHELFERQAACTPAAVALSCGAERVSYAELNARANQLARFLRGLGCGPETVVGLCLERSVEAVVALLGVLKSGAAYLPLEPGLPAGRLRLMAADSGARLVLTRGWWAELLAGCEAEVVRLEECGEEIVGQDEGEVRGGAGGENLAYVIYTSGSTGSPKGVMVTHRGVVNYLTWCARSYAAAEGSGAPVHSSIGFDLTVTSLFAPLVVGRAVTLVPECEGIEGLGAALRQADSDFSLVKLTPAHLAVLAQQFATEGDPIRAKAFIIGGEALRERDLDFWRRQTPATRLINEYGPTETVVGCCVYEAREASPYTDAVPIGRPVANTQIYLLDEQLQPVTSGATSQIFIGGVGLARGYRGSPDLTAERFIPDPFGPEAGARLYRTGDLGRRLPDGNIEFLGRADEQVKIRGYRVEPGEVEAALGLHAAVRECAVVARGEASEKRLVAYVVAREGMKAESGELREHLRGLVPEYMVPGAWVFLERIPLSSNGKVDRRALPEPEREVAGRAYVAPHGATEGQLAEIWEEVLGLDRVGAEDNFFELGGDSIISLQVVARANRAGIRLTPSLLFEHQTIAALAAQVGTTSETKAEQGPVSGPVPLTPIQSWFFEQGFADPHYFNQAVLLETRPGLDAEAVERAVGHLLRHHDALRLRFVECEAGWEQAIAEPGDRRAVSLIDLSAVPEEEQSGAVAATAAEIQTSLNLAGGPLLRCALIELGAQQPGRLLLVAHHLVVDGISWRILLEDLEAAYQQASRGEAISLPPKTTSFQDWSRRLTAYAQSDALRRELDYWTVTAREKVDALPVDLAGGANTVDSSRTLTVSLDVEETRALLQEVPPVYHTQINDVLLAALVQSFGQWTGRSSLLIDLEGHGREEIAEGADVSRTVGWFTTIFPVLLEVADGIDQVGALKSVKEQLRSVPNRGLGYGALRYLSRDERIAERLRNLPRAEVNFNYLGQADRSLAGAEWFAPSGEPTGPRQSGRATRSHLLEIDGIVFNGRLSFTLTYSEQVHRRSTIERLGHDFIAALRALIAHCLSPVAGGYTPSDFPLAGLSQRQLDQLVGAGRQVEDIYPLSPLQQGMLFHSLDQPHVGMYCTQLTCTLRGELDVVAFDRAWQRVVDRHAILRTTFTWERLPAPVQVVVREAILKVGRLDWSALSPDRQRALLEAQLKADRAHGYELSAAPPMRLTLVRLAPDSHQLIWNYHHLLLDGWSVSTLLREVFAHYRAAGRGEELRPEPSRPFRDYISWIRRQDGNEAEQFWRRSLRGFRAPTPLPERRASDHEEPSGEEEIRLTASETSALQSLAARHRLTLSTLLQGAWAVLLKRYTGEEDVVFGAVVSGRPPELAGVESMVGLLINTLPVRLRVPSGTPVVSWLKKLQVEQLERSRYDFSSLAQVQSWSEVAHGQPLFNSILVFENYPFDESAGRGNSLEVTDARSLERTNYPLTVVAIPGDELRLKMSYDGHRFDAATVARMLGHLSSLLRGIAADAESPVSRLPLLTAAEQRQHLVEWNRPSPAEREEPCLHELFERQAACTPAAVALSCGAERVSYAELNARANQLADHLRGLGCGPETVVGLCLERSVEAVVALLGVLKSGAAYLPLEPGLPRRRLQFMLEDARAAVLLTQAELRDGCGEYGGRVVCLDRDRGQIARHRADNVGGGVAAGDLAYVIYTSGSTGDPKGVMVTHRNVVRLFSATRHWFDFNERDVWTLFHSYAFDFSVWEVWGPLLHGGRLVIVPYWVSRSPESFLKLLAAEKVTVLNQTPSAFRQLMRADTAAAAELPLRFVIFGGEALEVSSLGAWFERRGDEQPRLINMYGITETTVHVTCRRITARDVAGGSQSPIGRAIPDLRLYLLDADQNLAPVGAPGELYVGGAGLARGYLGRPDLTSERFIPDPFGREPGARLYRSGDLGRYLGDGQIEFLGRADEQIKIRGFRVEPGEVEAALGQHAAVRECVVVARGDEAGDKRLVAYVIPRDGREPGTSELREHLRERLPEHMVPGAWVVLDELPLTINGKLDRRALPAPEQGAARAGAGGRAPATPHEELVAGAFAEVLGLEVVGAEESFFELGGHSLLATQVVSRLRAACGVELELRALFEAPTAAGLAAELGAQLLGEGEGRSGGIGCRERGEVLPLSFAQQRLWFLDRLVPDHPFYNTFAALRLSGRLDAGTLERTLNEIIRRHETLRTTFATNGGLPAQIIAPDLPLCLETVDLSAVPESEREAEALRLAAQEARRPFDLSRGPLLRATLLRLGPEEHVSLLNMHHIVSDAWSLGVLVREAGAIYAAFLKEEDGPLPELPVQYADFAVWQREWLQGEVLERQLAYWRGRLSGPPAVLELPADRPRPPVQSYSGATRSFRLPAALGASLNALARREDVTLFMLLLAAFKTLLSRYTGESDIVVGSPIANRNRAEIEGLIGFFVNTLALRTDLSGNPRFVDLLKRVRETALGAYAHQDLPFEKLVEELQPQRDLSRQPLFQVSFALQNAPLGALELPGLSLMPLEVDSRTAKFDLSLFLTETADGLAGALEYSADLFDDGTIERLIGHFRRLLEAIVADPERRLLDLPLLGAEERREQLIEWNQTDTPYSRDHFIHHLFEAQAGRTPAGVALSCGAERVSYAELNARANQLADHLRGLGCGPETVVGLCLERSVEAVVALLGVLKSGAAYLPLEPGLPRRRLQFMLEDARAAVLLTQAELRDGCGEYGGRVVCLDRDRGQIARHRADDVRRRVEAEHLAYVIYTSGSTGDPKGVMVTHGGLANYLHWSVGKYLEPGAGGAPWHSPLGFDLSVTSIFPPLLAGQRVSIVRGSPEVEALSQTLLGGGDDFSLVKITPAHLDVLGQELRGKAKGARAKALVIGGEALLGETLGYWRTQAPETRVINEYGPTETVVGCIVHETRAGEVEPGPVAIGRPIANTRVYVLDQRLNPVPVGVAGELYIGGEGVARGYLRRPDLTAERFIPDPYGPRRGSRLYRTGDLARYRADGSLEFLGRADDQVKIRGHRIEPGEVEAAIAAHPAVRQAAVTAREDAPGDKRLVAYVVADPAVSDDTELGGQLAEWQAVFDETYQQDATPTDPAFNIRGWNSSYTNLPLPAEEMRRWVDETLEWICAARPRRVLELGCGTGLLLLRLAPGCEEYWGVDFSQAALDSVSRQLTLPQLSHVKLLLRAADDLTGLTAGSFDTVILNSVAQYFPSVEYLARVLEGAVRVTGPGGRVLIGDVRSLRLQATFAASVELHKAPDSVPAAQLRQRVRQQMAEEPELLLDPAFFTALQERLPAISRVEIEPKRGGYDNELSKFRYQVTLHVGGRKAARGAGGASEWEDWGQTGLTFERLRQLLAADRPERLAITRIPNRRLAADSSLLALLEAADGPQTAGGLREAMRAAGATGMDPQQFRVLGEEAHYAVEVSWARHRNDGSFDVILRREGAGQEEAKSDVVSPAAGGASQVDGHRPWDGLANDPQSGRRLRALVPRLRASLKERLPEYMVPGAWVVLDELPLTINGKLDRRALPAPEQGAARAGAGGRAPATPHEELVAGAFAEVLGLEVVGAEESFFELGGHSLLATQVVSRLRAACGVELELRALFEAPTAAGLAAELDRRMRSGCEAVGFEIGRRERGEALPLSFAQQRLWFFAQLEPESAAYNVPIAVRLSGELSLQALEQTLEEIVRRHEVLRTTFGVVGTEPTQEIAPEMRLPLSRVDLSRLPAAEREAEARRLIEDESGRAFDLGRGPLVRVKLLGLGPQEHILLVTMHHIVSDGWSLSVLVQEVAALYQAFAAGRPSPLAELSIQYADFAAWQREWLQGAELERQLDYWKGQLAAAPAVLELPTDRPRPAVQTYRGAQQKLSLSPTLSAGLKALSRRSGTTLFMTLLAAFQTLLHRYAQQEEICVGTPIAGRNRAQIEGLIGFFVNTLVMRTSLSGNPRFSELLGRVRETVLGAMEHQDLPFEHLVEALQPIREMSHTPLFQVMFVLQNTPPQTLELSGLKLEPLPVKRDVTEFDLTLSLEEEDEVIRGELEYSTDLFDAETITRFIGHFENLLAGVVADPGRRVGELNLLTPAERLQVTAGRRDGHRAEGCLHGLFEAQAARTPEAVAVIYQDQQVTYRELNRRANQLAHYLRKSGVGPEVLVGTYLERSVEMMVCLLAILKAGGAYVPLDPAYPRERLAFMLEDLKLRALLTFGRHLEELPTAAAAAIICLDASREEISGEPEENPARRVTGDNLAYLLYTSGSTGRPKGVCLPHGAAASHFRSWQDEFQFDARDRVLQFASLSFDASIEQIFSALVCGAAVVLRDTPYWSGEDFYHQVRRYGVTVVDLPAAYWSQAASDLGADVTLGRALPLRVVTVGGEPMLPESVHLWQQSGVMDGVRLVNAYGPTEALITTTMFDLYGPASGRRVPIGRPIGNRAVYILDREGNPSPIGVSGEVHVGGPLLARGYFHLPELTAEKFIPDAFSGEPGARLYRTGDLGRYLGDGQIEFLGRADEQVKIRGFRVEPGEVEAALGQHAAVRECAVVARGEAGERRLVAYVVAGDGAGVEAAELREHLRVRLPEYMVPAAFVILERLPLTANGKVDRRALPEPDREARPSADDYLAPRNRVEAAFAAIWEEVLGVKRVGMEENFFELGGHSLLATQVVARARAAFGVELPLRRLFETPTVAGLAVAVIQGQAEQTGGDELARLLAEIEALSEDEAQTLYGKSHDPQDSSPDVG